MAKIKTSMRDMRKSNAVVVGVGYCDMQHTLKNKSPIAYASGVNGWNCDLYRVNERYSIVTGYNYSRACDVELYAPQNEELHKDLKTLEQRQSYDRDDKLSEEDCHKELVRILDKHIWGSRV